MKKLFAFLALFSLCGGAAAMDIGIGYNNGSPSVKLWWDGSFSSELAISWNYTNNDTSGPYISSAFTYTIAPLMWAFFRNDYGTVSAGIKFRNSLNFYDNLSIRDPKIFANDYTLVLAFPELEVNVPWVDGLRLTAATGINLSWFHDDTTGKFTGYGVSFSGFSLSSIGLMYYFSAGEPDPVSGTAAPVSEGGAK